MQSPPPQLAGENKTLRHHFVGCGISAQPFVAAHLYAEHRWDHLGFIAREGKLTLIPITIGGGVWPLAGMIIGALSIGRRHRTWIVWIFGRSRWVGSESCHGNPAGRIDKGEISAKPVGPNLSSSAGLCCYNLYFGPNYNVDHIGCNSVDRRGDQGNAANACRDPREKWTVQYPDEPITVQPRYRGQHLLHVDEIGKEKCVACYLCAAACPSDCIYIEAETTRVHTRNASAARATMKVYNIDYGRCIFCGYCVEACPKDAITHGYNFELSVYNRADLLKTKDDLLITKQKQSKNYRVALSSEDVDSEYKEV